MVDQYLLLANHIRDGWHNINQKVIKHGKNAPKWDLDIFPVKGVEMPVVEDFAFLLSIANVLEELAEHHKALALPPETGVNVIGGFGDHK